MMPARPAGGWRGPFALSTEGALEALVAEAGLTPREVQHVDCPFEYADLQTAVRGLIAAGPAVKAIQTSGEPRVRDAVLSALTGFKRTSGGYRMNNEFRFLVATA